MMAEKPLIDPRPLYRQAKALIIEGLTDGTWKPGAMLPSEPALADKFGVSAGTVRKALDELTAEHIVVRRQGRGTFAAEPDDNRILFHFFKLTGDDGVRRIPESEVTGVERGPPTGVERQALCLSGNQRVIRIHRTRRLDGAPVIAETIALPLGTFSDLDRQGDIPNNLYALYASRYGRTITSAREQLKAVNADERAAKALNVAKNTALLAIARTAFTPDGTVVEHRTSLCRTDGFRYEVDLK